MIRKKLNIPATMVRTVRGKQYKMDGMLLSINESEDTCTMRFNGIVKNDIPLNSVLINEGFIDKLKEYGKKAVSYIRQKVKGFFVLIDEATQKIFPGSEHNAGNIAICSARNMFKHTWFSPDPEMASELGISGVLSIDKVFQPLENEEIRQANKFFGLWMKRAGTTNETLQESADYIKKHYYKDVTYRYNNGSKSLNEKVIYSIGDIAVSKKGYGSYGRVVNATQLRQKIMQNIELQLKSGIGKKSAAPTPLIWGSPGIGKTAIMHDIANDFRNNKRSNLNLHIQTIQCAGMTIENWTLPTDNSVDMEYEGEKITVRRFTDTAKTWLPVYQYVPDEDVLQKTDKFFNSCRFLGEGAEKRYGSKDGKAFNGGIIFFDEFARTQANVQKIMFNLAADRSFGDNYVVASGWGFVFAANRAVDDYEVNSEAEEYFPAPAKNRRFVKFLYVPTKEEWIKWAETVNATTGLAKIEPFIIEFIKQAPEHVWYSTITNGGYDDLLEKPEVDKLAHEGDDPTNDIAHVLEQPDIFGTTRMVTPATWEALSNIYRDQLENIFYGNSLKLDPKELIAKLVEESKIKTAASNENVPEGFEVEAPTDYYGGIKQDVLINALNRYVPDDMWEDWVDNNGGEKALNLGQIEGKNKRFNMLMTWWLENVMDYTGDNTGANYLESKSPLMKAWISYQSYDKVFTDDVIRSIWDTGKMPPEYQKDDDIVPAKRQFDSTQYSKWKNTITIAEQVFTKVFDNFPEDMDSVMTDDIQEMNTDNFAGMSDADIIAEGKKMQKKYSFKLQKEDVNQLLIEDDDFNNIQLLKTKLNTLKNSKLAQYLCNFCIWASKVSLQNGSGRFAQYVAEKLDNYFKTEVNLHLYNILADRKNTRITNQRQNKNQNDLEAVNANNIQLCKDPAMLARYVLQNAMEKENNETMGLYDQQ